MPLITLTSDLGSKDNYVALVKAEILKSLPLATFIDISHEIEKFNGMHAAYLFGNVFREFAPGTWHLVGIKSHVDAKRLLLIEISGQYIVCPDNGFFTLLPGMEGAQVHALDPTEFPVNLFFFRNSMVKALVFFIQGGLGSRELEHCNDYLQLVSFQPTATPYSIIGRCVYIDSFGNVVTNITKAFFSQVCADRKFTIHLPGVRISRIVKDYQDVAESSALALFNSFDYLEIAINRAKASQLLFPKSAPTNTDFSITIEFG